MTLTTDLPLSAPRTPLAAARGRIASGLRRSRERTAERKQMERLLDCDDHLLNDIGVSRDEVRLRLRRRSA